MSAYNNNPMISDEELRALFKVAIMEADETNALTETFIEMERKMVFSAEAPVMIPLLKEQELFAKLHHTAGSKLAAATTKIGMKWFLGGLGTVCATTGLVVYQQFSSGNSGNDQPAKPAVALITTADTTSEEPDTTDTLTTLVQQTPAFLPFYVAKPIVEMKPLPFTFIREEEATLRGAVEPLYCVETPDYATPADPVESASPVAAVDPNDDTISVMAYQNIRRIEIDLSMADIRIEKATDDQVIVEPGVKGLILNDKNDLLKIMDESTQKGKKEKSGFRFGRMHNEDWETGEIIVRVPAGVILDLRTANGNINVADISAGMCTLECEFGDIHVLNSSTPLSIDAASGNVEIKNVTGDLRVNSDFGDVRMDHINGKINLTTSSGNVIGDDVKGDVTMQNDFGDVTFGHITGSLNLTASSGNISIDDLHGPTCTIISNFGNVRVVNTVAQTKLTVNSGNTNVHTLQGNLTVHSSYGDITALHVTGEMILNGNSGNITIEDLTGNVRAETQFGDMMIHNSIGNAYLTVNSGKIETKDMELKDSLTVSIDFGNGKFGLKNLNKDLRYDLEATFGEVKINKGDMKLEKENGVIVTGSGGIFIKGVANSGDLVFN